MFYQIMFDFVEVVDSLEICVLWGLAAETMMLQKMDFLFVKGLNLSKNNFSLSKYPDLVLQIKKFEFENTIFHI